MTEESEEQQPTEESENSESTDEEAEEEDTYVVSFTTREPPESPMTYKEWLKKDGWILGVCAVLICLLITAGIYLLCVKCCITEDLLVKEKVDWSQELALASAV